MLGSLNEHLGEVKLGGGFGLPTHCSGPGGVAVVDRPAPEARVWHWGQAHWGHPGSTSVFSQLRTRGFPLIKQPNSFLAPCTLLPTPCPSRFWGQLHTKS